MISGRQEFFFSSNLVGRIFFSFFSHKLSVTFVLHAIIFFRQLLTGIFFQNHPPPPEELNGRPLSCLVPQLVPGPHYYSARPERLWSRGPNEDPGKTPYTWYKPRTSKWRRSRWMEKVSYFLQRFLYGFKSTLQKGNAKLKKVLH